ncbi:MAG: HD domain-containing protein, partial [Chloroflexota bacterium]
MQQPAPRHKSAGPPDSSSEEVTLARGWLGLLRAIEPLKHLPRTGWLDREVASPESVAAHSWRLAVLAWIVASEVGLDANRAMAIALMHDLPEAVTGDHTPFDSL